MKSDVDKFNMVKRILNLDLQLAITVILKLDNFFAIFIFLAYRKAPEPSTNTPTRQPQKTIQTLGLDRTLQRINIVLNIFYINFFPCVACSFGQSKGLGCRLYPQSMRKHLGTFENLNIPILNSNPFIFMIPTLKLQLFIDNAIHNFLQLMLYIGSVVNEPNCSVATDWGQNTATHKV